MKILLFSSLFAPQVGGMETQMKLLAYAFTELGHNLQVFTNTEETAHEAFPFPVYRNPDIKIWKQALQWCDVQFHACISLRALWTRTCWSKPLVVTHHTWYRNAQGHRQVQDYLKCLLSKMCWNIAPSSSMARDIPAPSIIIPNAYDHTLFFTHHEQVPERDLLFVGRLVSDKGVSLLLEGLKLLQQKQMYPRLSIVGSGPEETTLREQVLHLDLQSQVQFCGVQQGSALAELYRSHRITVISSLCEETFGIVALEALACGCLLIASDAQGLREAAGNAAIFFPRGNTAALAEAMAQALTSSSEAQQQQAHHLVSHLASHKPQAIARQYIEVFERALQHQQSKYFFRASP